MWRVSFKETARQIEDGSKTVTRRMGWTHMKVGDLFLPVYQCQGLAKGQKQRVLGGPGPRVCLSNWREPLNVITHDDVVAEGFPEMTVGQFIAFFCRINRCKPPTEISRIKFTPTNRKDSER